MMIEERRRGLVEVFGDASQDGEGGSVRVGEEDEEDVPGGAAQGRRMAAPHGLKQRRVHATRTFEHWEVRSPDASRRESE